MKRHHSMGLDGEIIDELGKIKDLKFTLEFAGESFALDSVGIAKVQTPVTKRTERGGAYFTDAQIHQARARTRDGRIAKLASKAMLGPNTEFGDIRLTTHAIVGGRQVCAILHASMTSSMEGKSGVELVLTITDVELD